MISSQGAARQLWIISDIENGSQASSWPFASDILALHQDEVFIVLFNISVTFYLSPSLHNLVYTGCRDGSLKRMDIRVPSDKAVVLLDTNSSGGTRSITHLRMIDKWKLLLSTIRGDVSCLFLKKNQHLLNLFLTQPATHNLYLDNHNSKTTAGNA